MIRFKVIKASQILYYTVLVLVAAAAVILLLVTMLGGGDETSRSARTALPTATAAPRTALPATSTPTPTPQPEPSRLALPTIIIEQVPTEEQSAGEPLALIPAVPAMITVEKAVLGTGEFHVEVLLPEPASRDKPRILIYHTHNYEAYAQVEGDEYVETEEWRTADETHNITAVGARLAEELTSLGAQVVHDTTVHEPPKLGTAYERSLQTLQSHKDAGETYDLIVDVHRDAGTNPIVSTVDGVRCAKLMVLLGNGNGFKIKPEYEENLAFSEKLTAHLRSIAEDLCRDVKTKDGRYNQHMNTPAILVEVGNNRNTLQEALASMPYLAQCLMETLAG